MSRSKLPKYRRQKDRRADRAFVQLGSRRVYLGDYGSPESRELYERTVQEWLANGKQPAVDPAGLRVVELAARFWTFAKGFYRHPDGTSTSSLENYRIALRPLKRLYGSMLVSEFGPLCLKAIQADWVRQGLSRKSVNEFANLIKHIFKWGASEELVSASVYHALQAVEGLRRGRSDARETEPIRPVPEQDIEAIRPHVSRQVWALIQLQLLSGARPGELLRLRPIDLDTSGKVWTYRPTDHKTAWHGHSRTTSSADNRLRTLQVQLTTAAGALLPIPALPGSP